MLKPYQLKDLRRRLSAFHSRDQLRKRCLKSHGDAKQRHRLTVRFAPFEFLESVDVHSGGVRQRLLTQVPLFAALPNLVAEFLQGRPCAHVTRFEP